MNFSTKILNLLLLGLVLLLSGCVTGESIDVITDNSTISIGIMIPLTGFAAEDGLEVMQGYNLAQKDLAKQGIFVDLLYQDTKCDAKTAISAYRQLQVLDVDYMAGFACSGAALGVAPIAESEDQPLFVSVASSRELSKFTTSRYRYIPSDVYDAEVLLETVLVDDEYVLLHIANDYGYGMVDLLRSKTKPVAVESFVNGNQDFKSILAKINASGIRTVVLIGYPGNTVSFLEQKKQLGLDDIKVIGSTATYDQDLLSRSDITSNFVFTQFGSEVFFKDAFLEEYSISPHPPSAQFAYDTILAIVKSEGNDPRDIVFEGASGRVELDSNGDRVGFYPSLYEIQKGSLVCVERCD